MSKSVEVNRVLSLAMRPKTLSDMVGQQELTDAIKAQFTSGRIPHFYIIGGSIGSGKTSLARILSLHLQTGNGKELRELTDDDWKKYKHYDIEEINAANQNGVDYVRQLAESAKFRPLPPSKVKVLILDEAHQLSNSAQNCLLTETEDVAQHLFIVFCTSQVNKIIPGLRRRAYILQPKALTVEGTTELLLQAKQFVGFQGEVADLTKMLVSEGVSTPGLVVQAAERFFCGLSAHESICFTDIAKFDGLPLCRALVSGDWPGCVGSLRDLLKSDVPAMKSCTLGYLKAVLLKSTGSKALAVSRAIALISATNTTDELSALPSFIGTICLACESMSPPRAPAKIANKAPLEKTVEKEKEKSMKVPPPAEKPVEKEKEKPSHPPSKMKRDSNKDCS